MDNLANTATPRTTQFPQTAIKKRKELKLSSIYHRGLLTKSVVLPFNVIGKNLDETLESYIHSNFEGKCVVEGYVRPNSTKIIKYSSGTIIRGINVKFEVVFECDLCYLVEGMIVQCVSKNIVKAGIRAESAVDVPSPIDVFIAKDHNYAQNAQTQYFSSIKEGDKINVRVIGQRFELNKNYISVIGELVREKEYYVKPKNVTIRKNG